MCFTNEEFYGNFKRHGLGKRTVNSLINKQKIKALPDAYEDSIYFLVDDEPYFKLVRCVDMNEDGELYTFMDVVDLKPARTPATPHEYRLMKG